MLPFLSEDSTSYASEGTSWQPCGRTRRLSRYCPPCATPATPSLCRGDRKTAAKLQCHAQMRLSSTTSIWGVVDKGDQMQQYYRIRLKSVKNYKYIFWFLLDVAITNAYILLRYVPVTTSVQSLKVFRLKLAEQLCAQNLA